MFTSARTLITDALIELNVIDVTSSPNSDDADYALRTLNRILKRLNAEYGAVNTYSRQTFALTAGQQSYTFGPSANLNTTDNGFIDLASVIYNGDAELSLKILDYGAWADIASKDDPGLPCYLYDAKAGPINTLQLWPVPDSAYTLVLYTRHKIPEFATLNDTLSAPDHYEEAIMCELAMALAGSYGTQASPALQARHMKAWNALAVWNQGRLEGNPLVHYRLPSATPDIKTNRLI